MNKKNFVFMLIAIAGFFMVSASASQVDGKWKAIVPTPEGDMELLYVFKVDGEKLTGSLTTQMGEVQIYNGKVEGEEFSFDIDPGMGYPIPHKFKLDKEIIRITVTLDGTPYDYILTKAKEE